MTEVWPQVRAVLLTVVLLMHLLIAAPVPHKVTWDDMKNPVSADELTAWHKRLQALGWSGTRKNLGDQVVRITGWLSGAHHTLTDPYRPIGRWTGTGQGWALFANPDTHPTKVEIWVERGGKPELAYTRHGGSDQPLAHQLAYRRMRAISETGTRKKPRGLYPRFAKWAARRMIAADPAITTVTIRTVSTNTPLPPKKPNNKWKVRNELSFQSSEL